MNSVTAAIAITSMAGLALLILGSVLGYKVGKRQRNSYYESLRRQALDKWEEQIERATYAGEILDTHRSISQEIPDEPHLRFSEMGFALETQLNLVRGNVSKANYEKVLRSFLTKPFQPTEPTASCSGTLEDA